jgi:hypothetical protein
MAFEADEDWVAVGHVEYLLDRMSSASVLGDDRITAFQVSTAFH